MPNADPGLTTRRIEALTDGVFAIAMTLLVLTLDLPQINKGMVPRCQLHDFLFSQWYVLYNYALSFILLAMFWVMHHVQFHLIQRTDRIHLWINMIILLFIALVPFSTSLVGDFHGVRLAEFFFSANLFIVALLFLLNWLYSSYNHRLINKEMSKEEMKKITLRGLVFPAVALLSVVLSVFWPAHSSEAFFLVPLLLLLPPFRQ